MTQKEDESLEDFMERLQYNLQRSDHPDMSKDILKSILLRGVRDDCLDMLNMLGKGDISKESYDEIINLCKDVQEEQQADQRAKTVHTQESRNQQVEGKHGPK